MPGLVPAIPASGLGAQPAEVTGTSPVMTWPGHGPPASVRRRVAVGAELEDEIGWDAQPARIALAAVATEPGAVRLLLAEILGIEMAGDAGSALQELRMPVARPARQVHLRWLCVRVGSRRQAPPQPP